ncbi:hypothetical protein [Arachidicoccus terrestris]|uniref:hypothetical protein n=1 Tax=Arachidicoccus terrestris TaxID=2875539 RepID=UPI001CC39906|nr:hypothetical protein [Arachidicoccus terrestris]UAY55257.1 hypothetical protein K9M52_17885 [Arachidicoccus terrestris]
MKKDLLPCLLLSLILVSFGCKKNDDIQKINVKQGTYFLSNTVYYEAPTLYTNQGSTADRNIIGGVLKYWAYGKSWPDFFGEDFPEKLLHDFKQYTGTQTLEEPPGNSILKILPGPIALFIHFPSLKDTVICDIAANKDGTYTLINRDSSNFYGSGCSGLEIAMLNTAGFRRYTINSASQEILTYRGRNQFLIDIKDGQIELHVADLFIYSSGSCWKFTSNTPKRYSPPDVKLLEVADTILLQNKKFVYRQQ